MQIFISASFFTLIFWSLLGWKGMISFIPFWMIFEFYYRIRVRGQLVCHECGFDPVLYLVDAKSAREDVEKHLRKRYANSGLPFPGDHQGDEAEPTTDEGAIAEKEQVPQPVE